LNLIYDYIMDSLILFYFIHSIVSFIISIIASQFLMKKFTSKRYNYILFFFMLNISLPIVGYLMSIWIVYYLLTMKHEKQLHNINMINMIEFENEFPKTTRVFGEAAMDDLLGNEEEGSNSSLKMRALVSLADNAGKNDVALIKNRLSDKNDEIRLFSFAIIDKLQRGLNGQIHDKMQLFENAQKLQTKAKWAEELAYLYWDLIYYELADSDLKNFIAQEVKKYAFIALEHDTNNAKIHVLLGKTYFSLKEIDKAKKHFTKAIEDGDALSS